MHYFNNVKGKCEKALVFVFTIRSLLPVNSTALDEYLHTWKLKLSTTKTVPPVFHLNNKEAKRELKLNFNNETLPFCPEPKYLGVTLDRSLTYRRHLESLCKKLTSRGALLRRLAGSGWGAGATTLRIAIPALMHSTTEYCAPVWRCSAHTRLIDPAINDVLRIVTGYLCPTPADNLPILEDIQPAELRRKGATLSLARCAVDPGHLLHLALTCPSGAVARRHKSRHPFVSAAQQLISFSDNNNIRATHWADHQWNAECLDEPHYRLRIFIPDIGTHPPGMVLPRTAWIRLLPPPHMCRRTFPLLFARMGYMAPFAACECGAEEQTVDRVVLQCPIHRPPHGLHVLTVLDD